MIDIHVKMAAIINKCMSLASLGITRSVLKGPVISVFSKQFHTNIYPLQIQTSPCLWAEPLKKKKKLNPAIVKMRLDRRKRKLEKMIRKHEKAEKKLKPLEEMDITPQFKREISKRNRKTPALSFEEQDRRTELLALWSVYKNQQYQAELQMIDQMVESQHRALMALREESEELYQEAIQLDPTLIPFNATGPVHTPPIEGYDPPDGDYVDVSRKWD